MGDLRSWLAGIVLCGFSAAVAEAQTAPQAYEQLADHLEQALETSQALTEQMGGYDAVFRRDPLRPLVDAKGELISSIGLQGGLIAQGVIWSSDNPLVIVDDELFAPGDTLGPYTILHIQADGVVVKRPGQAALLIPLDRGLSPEQQGQADPTTATSDSTSSTP